MINKRGSRRLRKALYMPPMAIGVRHNSNAKEFYQRLLSAGKKPICAIVACMRKLLPIAYGVLKSKKCFEPNWTNANFA